jgi:hypothetical protein
MLVGFIIWILVGIVSLIDHTLRLLNNEITFSELPLIQPLQKTGFSIIFRSIIVDRVAVKTLGERIGFG